MADSQTWPFLSIVAWPDGWDRNRVADLLAQSGGLDGASLRLRLGQAPPMVLERVEPAAAAAMIKALIAAGGDGFAFTLADLAAPGPAMTVRDLGIVEGALQVQLRQGPAKSLGFEAVKVVVRAHLSQTVTRRSEPPRHVESTVVKDVETSDKLDLHTADGGIYRIDGDRFGFAVLGELRGQGDKANMDRLVELLGHLCRDAVIDTFFRLWRPPPGFDGLRLAGPKFDAVDPAFEFYSRWAAMMWRRAAPP